MILFIYLLSLLQLLSIGEDINLLFAGDAMQHDRQIAAAKRGNVYDYKSCFQAVEDRVKAADYAVVNFECTLGGKPYKGYPCFSAPDSYAKALSEGGFDLFLHANNHCLDRRDAGLRRTLSEFDAMGIPHIGTYYNQEARNRKSPYIAYVKGAKIAFLNYTYGTNGICIQKDVVVNYINKQAIRQEIALARKANADLIVVCMHWGIEYKLLPNKEQKDLADFLTDEGVDLVIGGHPHVIQPIEIRHSARFNKDVLVAYSLGNFISAMKTTDTRGGIILNVTIGSKEGNFYLKDASYQLVFVQSPTSSMRNYVVVPSDKKNMLSKSAMQGYEKFAKNARKIFNAYNVNVGESQSFR